MNWAAIIVLALGFPLVGSAIGASMVGKKYLSMKENPHEFGLEEKDFRRRNFGKYVVIQSLFQTGPIYGLLIVVILYLHALGLNISDEILSKFSVTIALAIGAPALFSNISRGFISKEGIESIAQDPKTFGKAIFHAVVVETPMIFGLLIAVLSLNFSGLFQGEFWLTIHQIDEMLNSIIIFSCFCFGILFSGILLKKIEGPFSIANFSKGAIVNVLGTLPPVIGLMYVIVKFMEIGIFTGR